MSSCKKEEYIDIHVPNNINIIYENGNKYNQTYSYENDTLTKIETDTLIHTFFYSKGRIGREEIYSKKTNKREIYYIYRYNDNGMLSKMEYWAANIPAGKKHQKKSILSKFKYNTLNINSFHKNNLWDIHYFYEEYLYGINNEIRQINFYLIDGTGIYQRETYSILIDYERGNISKMTLYDNNYKEELKYSYDDYSCPGSCLKLPSAYNTYKNNITKKEHYINYELFETIHYRYKYNENNLPYQVLEKDNNLIYTKDITYKTLSIIQQ